MTLEQADASRQRAARMFESFGDQDSAAEFDGMTAEEYAERKGVEIIASNPGRLRRYNPRGARPPTFTLERNITEMAKSQALEAAHDTISDIYDKVQEAGTTRFSMGEALNEIADLCTDELPELDETTSDDAGDAGDPNDTEEDE